MNGEQEPDPYGITAADPRCFVGWRTDTDSVWPWDAKTLISCSINAPRTRARNFTGLVFAVLAIEFSPNPKKRSQSFSERQPMLFANCEGDILFRSKS